MAPLVYQKGAAGRRRMLGLAPGFAGFAALLAFGPSPTTAHADAGVEGASKPQTLPRVVVTGSNLRTVEAEPTSPVLTLTREDIARTGASSVAELLRSRATGSGLALSDIGGNGLSAAGASAAGSRGLSSANTLVLLNSRRLAPYPLANDAEIFVNIDTLPFEAIERVEVLRSGGAAVYGSDAVAGVINIITRSDYQGLYAKVGAQQSLTSHSFGQRNASLSGGIGNLAVDRYNLLLSIDLFERDSVIWRDVLPYVNPTITAKFPSVGSFSSYSSPGNVIGAGPVPGCAPAMVIDGLCRYDRFQRFEAIPAAQRSNLLGSGTFDFGRGLQGFTELLLARTKTTYLSPFLTYGKALDPVIWPNPETGGLNRFNYTGLPAGHPLNPTGRDGAEFRYRFTDGPSYTIGQSTQYRALAGLRGTTQGFDWESAAGVMGGHADLILRGWWSASAFRRLIGNDDPTQVDPQFFNRGYKIGGPNSAAVTDALFPTYGARGSTTQLFVDGKASGDVLRLPAGALSLAAGFDLRHERYTMTPTANLESGDIVGNTVNGVQGARSYGSVFAEATAPLARGLALQAAGRIDKFPGFPTHLAPKLALRFEPTPALLLRGTVEAGFRAPNLSESAASTKYSYANAVFDPKRCPPAQALAKDLRAAAAALPATDPQRTLLSARADNVESGACQASIATISQGNSALKPELSHSANVGLVLVPAAGASIAIDYWRIEVREQIGLKSPRELLANEDGLLLGAVTRAPLVNDTAFTAAERATYGVTVGAPIATNGRYENLARTETSGIDVRLLGKYATPAGDLQMLGNATYLLSYRSWSAVLGRYGDNLPGRSGYPRWRAEVTGALTSGKWSNALTANYSGATALHGDQFDTEYTIAGCASKGWTAAECRVASNLTIDYNVSYAGIRDLVLSMNVRNLLSRRPPVGLSSVYAGGAQLIPQDTSDVSRRVLRVVAEYRFR